MGKQWWECPTHFDITIVREILMFQVINSFFIWRYHIQNLITFFKKKNEKQQYLIINFILFHFKILVYFKISFEH